MTTEWERKPLAALADYVNGRAFKPSEWTAVGAPIVRIAQMTNPDKDANCFDGDVEERHQIDNGDLLFSWSATLMTRLWDRGPAILNQHIFRVIERPGADRGFLRHLIDHHIPELAERSHGSTMKHIRKGVLSDLEVLVPPLAEQKRIAEILRSVDEAIQATRAVIDQTRKVKQGLLQQLFTRGIGHTRFKQTEIGQTPESWDVVSLSEVTLRITDGTHQSPTFTDEGIVFFLVKTISRGVVDLESTRFVSTACYEKLTRRFRPQTGDVIYTVVGATYGVAIGVDWSFPFTFQRHIAHIRTNADRLCSEYLVETLNSPIGKRQADKMAVGNAQPTITLKSLRGYLIPLPPLVEQNQLANHAADIGAAVAHQISALTRLCSLKAGLMQDLLTGRVRVTS